MKGRVVRQHNIDRTLQIDYQKLTKAFEELKKGHKFLIWMIKKCTKTAKSFRFKQVKKGTSMMREALAIMNNRSLIMMTTPQLVLKKYSSIKWMSNFVVNKFFIV